MPVWPFYFIAAILAAVDLIRVRAESLTAWAVLILAVALLWPSIHG